MYPILAAAGENVDMKWIALAAVLAIPACAAELQPKTVEARRASEVGGVGQASWTVL
jgi:hypothetical protein